MRSFPGDVRWATLVGLMLLCACSAAVGAVEEASASKPITLTIDPSHPVRKVTPLLFGVQWVYWFPGLYAGTLPADQAGSHREQFVDLIKRLHIGAARFPGGTNSHWYFARSVAKTKALLKLLQSHGVANVTNAWPKNHAPGWRDVCDTAKAAGAKIIYQLNTSFYLDENGAIRPVCDSKFTRLTGLADGKDHSREAAASLDRAFAQGVFKPGDVDYWEIGNEEFAKMKPEQYADIAAAYARVLIKRDPGRPICYTGQWRGADMAKLLKERGVLQYFTGQTAHYPFGRWPKPTPAINTADYRAMANADVDFTKNIETFVKQRDAMGIAPNLGYSVSETSIYKYWTFDPFRMTCSFAHALAFARNWSALIRQPVVDMAVYHDLESPYFGMAMYHVKFTRSRRCFEWMGPGDAKRVDNKRSVTFPDSYFVTPTAHVFSMMANLVGAELYAIQLSRPGMLTGALVGRDGGRTLLFVSNPGDQPVAMRMPWPTQWAKPISGRWRMLDADSVYPVLKDEYRQRMMDAPLPRNGGVKAMLPARSVQLFVWNDSGVKD